MVFSIVASGVLHLLNLNVYEIIEKTVLLSCVLLVVLSCGSSKQASKDTDALDMKSFARSWYSGF